MKRRDFFKALGIAGAALVAAPHLLNSVPYVNTYPVWPDFKLWHTAGKSLFGDRIEECVHIATEVKHEYAGKITFTSHRESCVVTGEYHDGHTITDAMDRLMYGIDEVTRFRKNAGT